MLHKLTQILNCVLFWFGRACNCRYFLSFIEYGIMNPKYFDCVAGRIEVTDEDDDYPYTIEEIGYFTGRRKEYMLFREVFDFINVPRCVLNFVRWYTRKRLQKRISE